jgi:antitoxin ParD1/3/4
MTSKGHDQLAGVEVLRGRKFTLECSLEHHDLAALKSDIDKGLGDISAGRVKDFDINQIIGRGRRLLTTR